MLVVLQFGLLGILFLNPAGAILINANYEEQMLREQHSNAITYQQDVVVLVGRINAGD